MNLQLNRNLMMLQLDQQDKSKGIREDIEVARNRQVEARVESLHDTEEAGKLKGDASDAQTRYNAIAMGLAAAAACCMLIPVVGAAIAAVLAVVAAVFALLGHLESKGKQQEAAELEKEAGVHDIASEHEKSRIEELKEEDQEREEYVDQLREQIREANLEQSAAAKA